MSHPLSKYVRNSGEVEIEGSDLDYEKSSHPLSKYVKKPEESFYQKSEKAAKSLARGAGATVIGLPRFASGLLKHGSEAFARKGQEQAKQEGREITPSEAKFTEYVTKVLGYPEELLQKIGLPTQEEVSQWHRKQTGDANRELAGYEKGFETGGSVLGGSALTPGASLGTPSRALATGLSAAGAGTAAGLGGGAGSQVAAGIGLPAIVSLISSIASGKLMPSGAQAKQIYEFLKKEGLSDVEITPILQGKMKKELIGGIAQPTSRGARAIEASEGALGNIYNDIKEKAANVPKANHKDAQKVVDALRKTTADLRKSKMIPADKEAAINKMEELATRIENEGIDSAEIVATWQDANSVINWNSFKDRKRVLNAIKEPLGNLMAKIDPKNYVRFTKANQAWGRFQDTARKIRPTEITKFVKFGEAGAWGKALYDLALTGNPLALKGLAGAKAARLLAGEMLINPRLNNLMNKTIQGLSSGTKAGTQKAIREFQEGLKDYPDINKELDFSKLNKD